MAAMIVEEILDVEPLAVEHEEDARLEKQHPA